MGDNFIRKPVVFNRKSEKHMKILEEVKRRSPNFSGFIMSLLERHIFSDPPKEIPPLDEPERAEDLSIQDGEDELRVKLTPSPPPKIFKG